MSKKGDCEYCGTEGCPDCLPNENCLWKMECPNCRSHGPFWIVTTYWTKWTDDGTEEDLEPEFQEGALCRCDKCEHQARVRDFRTEEI